MIQTIGSSSAPGTQHTLSSFLTASLLLVSVFSVQDIAFEDSTSRRPNSTSPAWARSLNSPAICVCPSEWLPHPHSPSPSHQVVGSMEANSSSTFSTQNVQRQPSACTWRALDVGGMTETEDMSFLVLVPFQPWIPFWLVMEGMDDTGIRESLQVVSIGRPIKSNSRRPAGR